MQRSVISVVVGNLASKGLGVVREVLFAAWFGVDATAAAFRIAQTGFIVPTHAFIGDTLSAGLLPLYRQMRAEGRDEPRLLLIVAGLYGVLFSAAVTTGLFLGAAAVAKAVAPGASAPALALASGFLKIMALATPFYVLSGMLGYVEAAYGRYGAVAFRPLLLNAGAIAGAALAVATGKDDWLAGGLVVGHVGFFLWTLNAMLRLDSPFPQSRQPLATVAAISRRFLGNTAPLVGLPVLTQCNALVERVVSSWLGTHVIPSVDYARFVADTAVQLIAVPLGLLTMSAYGGTDSDDARRHMSKVTAATMLLSFPAAAFVSLNAEAIVRLLFERGAFGGDSVALTAGILRWMGGGLGATVTGYYLIKALNARLRNLDALCVTGAACLINMAANAALWRPLGPPAIGVAYSAYGFALVALCLTRLRLWREVTPLMAWVAAGTALQLAVSLLMPGRLKFPYELAANAAAAGVIWLGLAAYCPPVRAAAKPVADRLLGRFGRATR